MAIINLGLAGILFFASCIAAAETFSIELKNNLEKCVILSNKGVTYFNDIPILNLNVSPILAHGVCGCKSAISQYRVYGVREGHESLVIASDFIPVGRSQLQLPIAAQKKILAGVKKINVVISCANPS